MLDAQQQRVGKTATSIFTKDGVTHVVYQRTAVVRFTPEWIELDSGGWRTVTTKTRMNQASNQFELGYSVYQKGGEWFVDFKGETGPFEDGMILHR